MRIIGQTKNKNESTKTKLGWPRSSWIDQDQVGLTKTKLSWPRPGWVDQEQVELTKTKLGLTMVEESEME